MYRKTPSDPITDTNVIDGLYDRIRRIGVSCRKLVERYPLHFFTVMIVSILSSGILAFTVMRVGTPHTLPAFVPLPSKGVTTEFTAIIDTYGAIREVADLQQAIAGIIQKDSLTAADSVLLTDALKRFDGIQRSIMNNKNTNPKP